MNTERAAPRPAGEPLGAALWRRHTRTALNTDVQTQGAREIGVSIFERHTQFIASALRRMAGSGAAGGGAAARPVVIGRRVHFDPALPEFDASVVQAPPRAHAIRTDHVAAREGATGERVADRQTGESTDGEEGGNAGNGGEGGDGVPRAFASGEPVPIPGATREPHGNPYRRSDGQTHVAEPIAYIRAGFPAGAPTQVMRTGSTVARYSDGAGSPVERQIADQRAADRATALPFVGQPHAKGDDTSAPMTARTSAADTQSTSRASLPRPADALRSVVMRVPISAVMARNGTREMGAMTMPHAPGIAARHAVLAGLLGAGVEAGAGTSAGASRVTRVGREAALSPQPLVVALRRWFEAADTTTHRAFAHAASQDQPGSAAPTSGVNAQGADIRPAGGIDGSTRIDRDTRHDRVTPLPSSPLHTGVPDRGEACAAAMESRAIDRTSAVAGPAAPGIEGSSLGDERPAGRATIDAQSPGHASAASMAATAAGREDASAFHAGPAVCRPSPAAPVADPTVSRVTEKNAHSIVQLLHAAKVPSGKDFAAPAARQSGSAGASSTESDCPSHEARDHAQLVHRAASLAMQDVAPPDLTEKNAHSIAQLLRAAKVPSGKDFAAPAARQLGSAAASSTESDCPSHEARDHSQPVHRAASSAMRDVAPPDLGGGWMSAATGILRSAMIDTGLSSANGHVGSSAAQNARADKAAFPRATVSAANSPLPVGARGETRRLPLPVRSGEAVTISAAHGPAPDGGLGLPVPSTRPASVARPGDAALEPDGAALEPGGAPLKPDDAATTSSGRIAPASASAPHRTVSDAAPRPLVVSDSAGLPADQTGSRVPGFLRVFASAGTFAARATPEAMRSLHAAPTRIGRADPHSAAVPGELPVRETEAALPVDRVAELYGVVPADIHRAAALPPAAPASGRLGDANELVERAWQLIQDKLACERERRGYAPWP